MNVRKRIVSAAAIGMLAAGHASAQRPSCPQVEVKNGVECVLGLQRPATVVLGLFAADGKPMANESIQLTASVGSVPSVVVTNAQGLASIQWDGPTGGGPVTITAVSMLNGAPQRTTISLTPVHKKPSTLEVVGGDHQYWYAGKQVQHPLVVQLTDATSENCKDGIVSFKAIGDGVVSPDSMRGEWRDGRCIADARWKLGTTVGDQHLRATLGTDGAGQARASARARALPWFATGLAWTSVSAFTQVTEAKRTLHIVDKSSPREISYDTIVTTKAATDVGATHAFSPTIGVNWPLWYASPKYRVSLSADARDLTNNWFAGVSVSQFIYGIYHEDIGIDFQIAGHFARRAVLKSAADCAAGNCETRMATQFLGLGGMVQFNGSTVLAAIVGAFAK